jgi:ATP-dependent DNA helicase RecG
VIDISAKKIAELIKIGESEAIEFKKSFNDEALETIGAFANAGGGTIIIGIKDSGEICGFQVGKKTIEDIANQIQDATDPRLQPSLSTMVFENNTLVIIQVPPVSGVPLSVRGKYFKRTGKTNQRMSHEEIMQRMIRSTGLSWDATVEPTATLDDLNYQQIDNFIQKVKDIGRKPIPNKISSQEFLSKLELVRNETPTRAALLLFGKNPESFFSSAFLKLGRFRTPIHIVDDREIHGNLFEQLDGAINWFRERLETEFIITGNPEREVKWEYPLKAIREAVTNAIVHRDYTSLAHSQIRLYDDHLKIWNAGGLPPSLTPEKLLVEHDSVPRNRKIAEAFFYCGLIEQWGSGTLRIVEELQDSGLPSPQFVSESNHFRLTLYRDIFTEDHLRKMDLSDRQLKIIAYLKTHGNITSSIYQSLVNVSKRTAIRELNDLKNKGIISKEGTAGPGTLYKLKVP